MGGLSKNHPRPGTSHLHLDMSRRQAIDLLLQHLSTDDGVRAAFVKDPIKVFAEYGLEVDPAQLPRERNLPSKEKIAAARSEMLPDVDAEFNFFSLNLYPRKGRG